MVRFCQRSWSYLAVIASSCLLPDCFGNVLANPAVYYLTVMVWFGQQLFVSLQDAGLVRELVQFVEIVRPDIRPEWLSIGQWKC
jgi:hypothetical protein